MKTIKALIHDHNLLKRCLLTLAVLVAIRLLFCIPTPGTNTAYFVDYVENDSAFGFLNALTGNAMSTMSIMAINIMPYITASIVVQLLAVIIPGMRKMTKGPKRDQKKLRQITFAISVGIAILESYATAVSFGDSGLLADNSMEYVLLVTSIWTFCAALISFAIVKMEEHNELFIGKAMSIILLTNILSSYPSDAFLLWSAFGAGRETMDAVISMGIVSVIIFILFAGTVVIKSIEKRIPVFYTGKIGNKGEGLSDQYIPLTLCPGSVIPVIFASSFIMIPVIIFSFITTESVEFLNYLEISNWFDPEYPQYSLGAIAYVALIFGFSFFYQEIHNSPAQLAQDLRKAGAVIPDVRQGKETEKFLRKNMSRLTIAGATALSVIGLIPAFLSAVFGLSRLSFLGTSIIITVGVILDTAKEISTAANNDYYITASKDGVFYDQAIQETSQSLRT